MDATGTIPGTIGNSGERAEILSRGNYREGLVREGGIEPPRAEAHKILSLARLPVSPLPHVLSGGFVTSGSMQVKDFTQEGWKAGRLEGQEAPKPPSSQPGISGRLLTAEN